MSDKRSVLTDALETLGNIIGDKEKRDAIHLAVEPIIAGHDIYPGSHVGIGRDGKAYEQGNKLIGIVDPFITGPVRKDQRFWLVIYPRKITSLRHVWTHPDLPDSDLILTNDKKISEQWLRDFCKQDGIPDYEIMIYHALNGYMRDSEYLIIGDSDACGDIPPEFWVHLEILTGNKIPEDRKAKYLGCAC